jgi:hypothetical protein
MKIGLGDGSMNFNHERYENCLKSAGVNEDIIAQIVNVLYQPNEDEKQDSANYCAAVMAKCDELLGFDITAEAMFHRACCKDGFRLKNSQKVARRRSGKPLEKKLALLAKQKYMGHPHLTEDGDIYTGHCAGSGPQGSLQCSCWCFDGCLPEQGKMPLSYCLCCAGHFRFHYQTALGVQLRVKEIVSSVFGEEPQYCSFLFEIVEEAK